MKITHIAGVSSVMKAYGKNVKKMTGVKKATDKVEISSVAKELQVARKAFDELPEIREDRVAEIKQLMISGEYHPSVEDTVEKLMSSVGF